MNVKLQNCHKSGGGGGGLLEVVGGFFGGMGFFLGVLLWGGVWFWIIGDFFVV